jgi:hypothetical protein
MGRIEPGHVHVAEKKHHLLRMPQIWWLWLCLGVCVLRQSVRSLS